MKNTCKINKIKILKEKLKNKNWVNNKIQELLTFSNQLNTFKMFECSDFFRGYTVASRNRKWANKRELQINRQIVFLESLKF